MRRPWAIHLDVRRGSVAIVFITDYFRQSHQSEIDASLRHEMLSRGMSAADIKTVLDARTAGEATRLAPGGCQGVRVGMGKFQIEVGGANSSKASTPAAVQV